MDFDIDKERAQVSLLVLGLVRQRKLKPFSEFSGINYRTLLEIRYNKCKPKFETIQKIKAKYLEYSEG
jgi:hypothetical protein